MALRAWHIHEPYEPGYPADYWWLESECGCVWRRGDEGDTWWTASLIVHRDDACPWMPEGHPRSEIDISERMYTPCLLCPMDIGSRFRRIPHPLDVLEPEPGSQPEPQSWPVAVAPRSSRRFVDGMKTTFAVIGMLVMSYLVFSACGGGGVAGWGL